jgi:hypothetical protein
MVGSPDFRTLGPVLGSERPVKRRMLADDGDRICGRALEG